MIAVESLMLLLLALAVVVLYQRLVAVEREVASLRIEVEANSAIVKSTEFPSIPEQKKHRTMWGD